MLRIRRREPDPLFFDIIERPRDELLHWARRSPEERRQRRAPIDFDMFHGGDVVDTIVSEFDGKCAFCETDLGGSDGVDHFRPLSSPLGDSSQDYQDHYSWLAYEWLNIFLICARCKDAKGHWFPVTGRRANFLATFDEVRVQEKPLLIDPTRDNPASHLSFLASGECIPRLNSAKGRATVRILRLNDDYLLNLRREAIQDALQTWRQALARQRDFPTGFLRHGPFLGSRRDVIRRSLNEFGLTPLPLSSGAGLERDLRHLLAGSDRDERDRMIAGLELFENADRTRFAQLEQGEARDPEPVGGAIWSVAPQPELLPPASEIASIEVANFRAIDRVRIPMPRKRSSKAGAPCLLLLGENAVGKSTCLAAVALALLGTRQAKKLRLPYRELARSIARDAWDPWGRQPIEVRVGFHGESQAAEFHYDPRRDRLEGSSEQSAVVLGYGPHRNFFAARGRRGIDAAGKVRSLFDPMRPLPDPSNWLRDLRGHQFDAVARTIRTILPIGDDDDLVNDRRAGICVMAQGQLTPVARLSEGYRSVFAMVADMGRTLLEHWSSLEEAEAVVLIDEIETHLHPRWKMRVMSSLRRALPRVQFIATTHDPLCVRGMDDGEVIVLTRNDSGQVKLVEDLPSVVGMSAEQLLTSEYFGLASTIDPEIHLAIARLASGVEGDPTRIVGNEANRLVSRLTVGDSAAEQIIQEALVKYLRERERPIGSLSSNARVEAVGAVLNVLRASRVGG